MVVSLKKHVAGSKKSLEYCLKQYPQQKQFAQELISMILNRSGITKNPKILEIGAAQGLFVIACQELGYTCVGIEPSSNALTVSELLKKELKTNIRIDKGFAEYLPYNDESFDLVIALSVIEHVQDVEKVFAEIFRVLKRKGSFYFETTSSLCPKQDEIRFFPFFSWYPDKIKKKIMVWSMKHKPSLIGYSDAPALNWFTPWKTNQLLKKAGFYKIIDQWDFEVKKSEPIKEHIHKIIKSNKITKLLAGLFTTSSRYLAIKV